MDASEKLELAKTLSGEDDSGGKKKRTTIWDVVSVFPVTPASCGSISLIFYLFFSWMTLDLIYLQQLIAHHHVFCHIFIEKSSDLLQIGNWSVTSSPVL